MDKKVLDQAKENVREKITDLILNEKSGIDKIVDAIAYNDFIWDGDLKDAILEVRNAPLGSSERFSSLVSWLVKNDSDRKSLEKKSMEREEEIVLLEARIKELKKQIPQEM